MRVGIKARGPILALAAVVGAVGYSTTHDPVPAARAADRASLSTASGTLETSAAMVARDPQPTSELSPRGVGGADVSLTQGRAAQNAGRRPDNARADTPTTARRVTRVSGGITSAPAAVPTGFDPAAGNFSGLCPEQWLGDLTGNSTCHIIAGHLDPTTGTFVASITDTLTGTFMQDHSTGTLVLSERAVGNAYLGYAIVDGDIVASSGDPTFRCSQGHLTIPVQLSLAEAVGGYYGTWTHGCSGEPAATAPPPASAGPVYNPETTLAGGITSIPTAIPTSGNPTTFDFSGLAPENWFGSFTGASKADIISAHVDPATGDIVAHIVDNFVGVYMVDHSHGTLSIDETFTGNVFTGAGLIEGDIVSSGGDPTFLCVRGHVTMPLSANAAGSFGGYLGTWTHGCRK